ncbi:MAG: isochorismatase family protein [Acidimicrobiia bacterium]|nr:isochorismatase family protein [Acidimicrobiia bacterium]
MATIRQGNRLVLLVVDVQVGVVADAWNVEQVITNLVDVVNRARTANVPIVWVQHSDEELPHGSPAWQIVPELNPTPDEPIIHKHFNSSFEGTALDDLLTTLGATHILLAGTQTNWCVRATAYGALDRGYDLTLIADAHTAGDLHVGESHVVGAEDVVAELNAVMRWISYPGRTSTTALSADLDLGHT